VRRAIPIAALAALACAGCPKRPAPPPPAPRLVEIRVVDRTPADDRPAPVDVAALSARAADALRPAIPVATGPGAEPAHPGIDYRLKIDVRLEGAEADGKGVMRAFVEARLTRPGGPPGDAPIEDQALAERIYKQGEFPNRNEAFRAHLERAVGDVVKSLAARLKLHLGAASDIDFALGGPDPDLRGEAIRVAAERKERACVPALIALLKDDDATTRDRALGALVEIGDRRAVKPITEASKFADLGQLPKVIDALAALGGDEARAWLEFVQTGHQDPEVRELARSAIARLDRRAGRADAAP
jgi:HEAT repeats